MEYLLGYGAGLLTLINPCVLPILPIVLATALQTSRFGPLALAGGLSISFVTLGLGLATIGRSFGLTEQVVAQSAAVLMILFGLVLLVPRFSAGFATTTGGFAARADAGLDQVDQSGLQGQVLAGILLGAVWSPCVGPTLGGAISLAWQGESLLHAGAIMLAFALGVSTIVIALGYGARSALTKRRALMQRIATNGRPVIGAIFVVTGLALYFEIHQMIDVWALSILPAWLVDLSVSI